jgi:hypothetical protein
MTRSAIVPTILALCAAGSAAALDHEFAYAPMAVGSAAGTTPEYFVGVDAALASKLTDDYRVVADDTVLGVDAQFRSYGLGIALFTDWAVGQSTDYTRPGGKTNPGELLRTEIRVDWALEIRDPRDASIPLLQIIPHLNYVTYPNQRDVYTADYDNWLKDRQRWLGVDLWWALPVEGVELGAGVEQNLSSEWRATRAGLGGREFIQYNAVDLAFWQLINFADAEYRDVIGGEDKSGVTTVVAGGRGTVPMFGEGLFGYVEIEMSYWLDEDMRENMDDSGDVVISFGLNWQPE